MTGANRDVYSRDGMVRAKLFWMEQWSISGASRMYKICGLLAVLGLGTLTPVSADQNILTDGLQNSWENWSWDTTVDLNSTAQIHSGSASAAVTITAAWGAFSFYHPPFNSSPYT